MKTRKTRSGAVRAVALAVGLAVLAVLAGAGQAAAARPGDLAVEAMAICDRGKTYRMVAVMNVGGTKITGVRVGSVGGPEIRVPYIRKPNVAPDTPNVYVNGLPVVSATGTGPGGTLGPGQRVIVGHVVPGCGPYALVGYAIGNEVDDVFSAPNYGIDLGTAPLPAIPSDASVLVRHFAAAD